MNSAGEAVRIVTPESRERVPREDLPALLAALSGNEGPVTWIHAAYHETVVRALEGMGLGEIAVKSLRDGPERPRVEEFADHVYISVFSAETRFFEKASEAQEAWETGAARVVAGLPRLHELRLFLGSRWIISVGQIDDDEYEALADRVGKQVFSRGRGAGFVAYHICEWLVETLQPSLEALSDRIDALEDQLVLSSGAAPVQQLFALKRDLVDIRRLVAPLRDVMQRLGSHGVSYVEPDAEPSFRDVHDEVLRVVELLDTYRDILSSALDLHLSSVSNRLNRVMKQLTIVATMFMPLSFVVGLFGTNFAQMPFHSLLWFILMFVLLFLSLVGFLIYTRRRT